MRYMCKEESMGREGLNTPFYFMMKVGQQESQPGDVLSWDESASMRDNLAQACHFFLASLHLAKYIASV